MIVLLLLLPFFVLSAVVTWSGLGDYYSATDRHQHFPAWSVALLVISTIAIVLYVIYFVAKRIWEDIIEPPTVISGTILNKNTCEDDASLTFIAGQGGSDLHVNVLEAYHLTNSGELKPVDSDNWLGEHDFATSWWVWWPGWPRKMSIGSKVVETFVCAPEKMILFRLKPRWNVVSPQNAGSAAESETAATLRRMTSHQIGRRTKSAK